MQLVQDAAPRASGLMIAPMWAPVPAPGNAGGSTSAGSDCGANGAGAGAGVFNASSVSTGVAAVSWSGDMVLTGFSSVVFSWDQVTFTGTLLKRFFPQTYLYMRVVRGHEWQQALPMPRYAASPCLGRRTNIDALMVVPQAWFRSIFALLRARC